jgi:glycosyltransferase involved in cell wall biosynthesis
VSFCFFITPTIWRQSLRRTIDSVRAQTDGDWEMLVFGDGNGANQMYSRFPWIPDDRFHLAWGGPHNSAGLTRNHAIRCVRACYDEPEWFAFVDDDDYVSPYYVNALRARAMEHPDSGVVVHRMMHPNYGVLPAWSNPEIRHGRVGISYAVRADVLPEDPFIKEDLTRPGPGNEDIDLLLRLGQTNHISITPNVNYFVREAA